MEIIGRIGRVAESKQKKDLAVKRDITLFNFKISTSVIILKPNKPNYTTPKSFRPIVLLSKLIEKLISVHMHFEGIACGIFHSSQFRGTQQHSTDDADFFSPMLYTWAGLREKSQAC